MRQHRLPALVLALARVLRAWQRGWGEGWGCLPVEVRRVWRPGERAQARGLGSSCSRHLSHLPGTPH